MPDPVLPDPVLPDPVLPDPVLPDPVLLESSGSGTGIDPIAMTEEKYKAGPECGPNLGMSVLISIVPALMSLFL